MCFFPLLEGLQPCNSRKNKVGYMIDPLHAAIFTEFHFLSIVKFISANFSILLMIAKMVEKKLGNNFFHFRVVVQN